ncbi:hypothetical protein GGI43DRAFT_426869 [Trichoderma evansii]
MGLILLINHDTLADVNFASGEQPPSLTCIYREKGQPGLRPGYGKAIEHRLSLLEDNVEKINQSILDVLNYVRAEPIAKSTSPIPGAVDGISAPLVIGKSSHSVQDILSPIRRDTTAANILPQAANSILEAEAINHTQLWPISQQLQEVDSFASSPVNTIIEQPPSTQAIHSLGAVGNGLPSPEILQELVELFFELIYPWAPLFFKPSFVANMYAPERRVLLHGVVIIAFRFWRKAEPSPETRDTYVKASPLTLLAVDSIGQDQGPRTWNVMSMLVTAAKHLNLSKNPSPASIETNTPLVRNEDPDEGLNASAVETEERRCLFWVIYSIDRLSSVSHGQPGGTDTKSIRLPYPVDDEEWGQAVPPEWFQATGPVKQNHGSRRMNLWHHYIDLLALLDRSNQLLIQPVNYSLPAHSQEWQSSFRRLDINLATWFENLSNEVREPPANFNPMWIMYKHSHVHSGGIPINIFALPKAITISSRPVSPGS